MTKDKVLINTPKDYRDKNDGQLSVTSNNVFSIWIVDYLNITVKTIKFVHSLFVKIIIIRRITKC